MVDSKDIEANGASRRAQRAVDMTALESKVDSTLLRLVALEGMAKQVEKIDKILEAVSTIRESILLVTERQNKNIADVKDHDIILRGDKENTGLVSKVKELERWQKWEIGIGTAVFIALLINVVITIVGHIYAP